MFGNINVDWTHIFFLSTLLARNTCLLHWSFVQNHFIEVMIYHNFKIYYINYEYPIQGAKNTQG